MSVNDNLNRILDDFLNKEQDDVISYFGDLETFFDVLKSRGLYTKLDLENYDSETWQNDYLLWLYENDKPRYYFWVGRFLGDVEIDPKTRKAYWIGDREDLADLFCGGHRNDVSQDTIRKILSDDGDWYDSYWDTTDDLYRDVIEELNSENIERLKEYIIENLKDKQLSPETEEMELIAAEQGHNDYWEINSEVVSRIIDDEESMNSLLDDELSDLKSELYSIHSNAYNSAYETTIYDEVWSELNDYFDGPGEWFSKPHPFKENTMVQKFKLPIRDLEGVVNEYLYNNKGFSQGTLEYQGALLTIIREDHDCLSVSIPDYPNYSTVDKNINLYFRDYI